MLRITLILLALLGLAGLALADDDDDGDILHRVQNKLVIQHEEAPPEVEDAPPPPPRPAPKRPAKPSRQAAPPPVPAEDPGPAFGQAGEDQHFLQPDDFFIQKHGLENHAWIWVNLAKSVTPASAGTKDEGQFMQIKSGQNLWTRHYWRSRVASQSELRIGMHAIMFNDNHRNDVYMAPQSKESARGGSWFYAKITDMSDVYKGYVTVSGNYKVSLGNIRAIERAPRPENVQYR